ncbi:MAG: choice-of-anchor Q domain-containing protein [Myxococcota bacterium]|nr:choice-of-anchor Q domain-containing protein [Myxococcota bacterium]
MDASKAAIASAAKREARGLHPGRSGGIPARICLPWLAVALWLAASVPAAAIVYDVDRTIGSGTVTGFIETDGTLGDVVTANLVDWQLTLTVGGTSVDLLGPASGDNSALTFVGLGFDATPSQLIATVSGGVAGFQVCLENAAFPGVCNLGEPNWTISQGGQFLEQIRDIPGEPDQTEGPFGAPGDLFVIGTTTPPPGDSLSQELGRFQGFVDLSVNGLGTVLGVGTVTVEKPTAASRVRAAYLVAAGVPGAVIPDGSISVQGTPVDFDVSLIARPSTGGLEFNNVAADVTDLVRSRIDAAPAGPIGIPVAEGGATQDIEGTVLAVVFERPDLTEPRSIVLQVGHQVQDGDTLTFDVEAPLDLNAPGALAELHLGIGSSCQSPGCPPGDDRVELRVGGTLLSSSAGGEDDALGPPFAGTRLSVGGIGDSPLNPNPTALPAGDTRTDDERYDLSGLLADGDTQVQVDTLSPSGDDNLFFAAFVGTSQPLVVNDFGDLPESNPGDGICASITGTCTLRAAIEESAAGGARTVLIPAGDYDLGGTALDVGAPVSLVGVLPNPGDAVRIDASGDSRVFDIDGVTSKIRVELVDLVITGGDGFGEPGGGMRVGNADVTLTRVSVENNTAESVGGIENEGCLTLIESQVTANFASGNSGGPGDAGGIRSIPGSELRIFDSTLSLNASGGNGGALQAQTPILVERTLFDTNSADVGGGISLDDPGRALSRLLESDFTNNTASTTGGGLATFAADVEILDATFADNAAGSGAGISTRTDASGAGITIVEDGRFLRNRADLLTFGDGGGIENQALLEVRDSLFDSNFTNGSGGGIANASNGAVGELRDSTFQGNVASARGGGIDSDGPALIFDSSFVGNQAGNSGGGLAGVGGLFVSGSLFSANVAADSGGGAAPNGFGSINDSTFSGNTATNGGGIGSQGIIALVNVTLTGNVAGAGSGALDAIEQVIALTNTLLDANTPADCGGGNLLSLGFNLDSDGSCPGSGPGDLSGLPALIGPLADNGGPTLTHALLFGSPAIDAGNALVAGSAPEACGLVDQRGVLRNAPLTGRCDIGAFEREGVEPIFFGETPTGDWPEAIEVVDSGNVAWIASQDAGLVVFDTSDVANPVELTTLLPDAALCPDGFNLQELLVEGDTLWIAAGTCGVIRADVSDPRAPVFLDRFDTPGFAVEIAQVEGSDELFVADHFSGLRSYDKTDPANVVELAEILTADFTVSPPFERAVLAVELGVRQGRTLAYVAAVDGVFVVDVTDPLLPEVEGEFLTSGPGCVPAGCLPTFSILDPVQQANLVFLPHQLHVDGERALVPAFRAGLMELDVVPQPDGSFLIAERQTLPTSQAFYRVESQGGIKFATEGQCGLRVLEDLPGGSPFYEDAILRNTVNPMPLGGFVDDLCQTDPFGSANPFVWDLVAREGLIWVTAGVFPASGVLSGSFEAIDFSLGSTTGPACGLLGLEPVVLLSALAWRRRRRASLRA